MNMSFRRLLSRPALPQPSDQAGDGSLSRCSRPLATDNAVKRARGRRLTQTERARVREVERFRTELLRSRDTLASYASSADPSFSSSDSRRTVRDVCRLAATRPRQAQRLFLLIREAEPQYCLEMGTSLGISAAYQAQALRLNGHGHLLTLERRPALVTIARHGLASFDLDNAEVREGAFEDHFPAVASERPWDFVFIDGHHDEEATQYYFSTLLPHVAPGALLVFDDVTWSEGMERAWTRVSEHPSLFSVYDLGRWGVCVVGEHVAHHDG